MKKKSIFHAFIHPIISPIRDPRGGDPCISNARNALARCVARQTSIVQKNDNNVEEILALPPVKVGGVIVMKETAIVGSYFIALTTQYLRRLGRWLPVLLLPFSELFLSPCFLYQSLPFQVIDLEGWDA